jgi:acetyl-CoA carboxylase carboxyltransferase component
MGPEGAANIIFKREIEASSNPEETRRKLIEEYKQQFANPYIAASRGYVDAVIDPRETRKYIMRALEVCETKVEYRPKKKHGNIPL